MRVGFRRGNETLGRGGGGILPYITYTGMCGPISTIDKGLVRN